MDVTVQADKSQTNLKLIYFELLARVVPLRSQYKNNHILQQLLLFFIIFIIGSHSS